MYSHHIKSFSQEQVRTYLFLVISLETSVYNRQKEGETMTQEMENTVSVNIGCPVAKTVGVIGGKWKGVILYHLTTGPRRYNEIRRTLPNITQRMLTLQLRELERDGIVHREIYNENPPRVEYSLTPLGDTLRPLLDFMRDWGVFYGEQTCEPTAANSKCGKPSG